MQLISSQQKRYSIRVDVLEDPWVLSQVLGIGDMIYATSERKVKIGEGENAKSVRKLIHIELEVLECNFEGNQLRITGLITNETAYTSKKSSHTHSITIGDLLEFEKKEFGVYEKKLFDDAIKYKSTKNLLVLLDNSEIIVAEFSNLNYSILFSQQGLGQKKGSGVSIDENEEKLEIISPFLDKKYSQIIFSGPGFWKESFKKYVELKKNISLISHSYSEVNNQAIPKIISELLKSGQLKDNKIAQEYSEIQNLLFQLSQNKLVEYGFDQVKNSVIEGKVEKLFVTTDFISIQRQNKSYFELNELFVLVEKLKGNIIIVDSKNEPGHVLKGLGGIAVLLRY